MKDSVIAVFDDREQAELAARSLVDNGFALDQVFLSLPKGDMGIPLGGAQPEQENGSRDVGVGPTPIMLGVQGFTSGTFNGFPTFVTGGEGFEKLESIGRPWETTSDVQRYVSERLTPQGALVVVHPNGQDSVAAYEILNSYGGETMDSTRPEEKALYEGYNLWQVPVGEIFEENVQKDATEGGNFEDTVNMGNETIPIPAHLINEHGYVDPNIGLGDNDLLFNEFSEEDSDLLSNQDGGAFDPETRDELREEMFEEHQRE